MNGCVEGIKTAGGYTGAAICVVVGAAVVIALAPLVSLVAVPYFAARALPKWIEHRSLYNKTLTVEDNRDPRILNLVREKFGRVPGQDYTRWDGRFVQDRGDTDSARKRKLHELMGEHLHGYDGNGFSSSTPRSPDCPFKTAEDLQWLQLEAKRVKVKNSLDDEVKMIRGFAKAIIPIFGLLWVLGTETQVGGASQVGCTVCMTGGYDEENENAHWNTHYALNYHISTLSRQLQHTAHA